MRSGGSRVPEFDPFSEAADLLVVGAGIIGLSSAFHVKHGNPDAKVVVVDQNAACAQGNTARSAALLRNTFTSSTNLALADSSIDFYGHLVNDRKQQLGLHLYGYLWLMDGAGRDGNKDSVAQMRQHGVEVEEYDEAEIRKIPGMQTRVTADEEGQMLGLRDIEYGLFGKKCGAIEPDLLTQVYEKDFLADGGKVLYNTRVGGLLLEPKAGPMGIPGEPYMWQAPRVAGAKTGGGAIRAKKTLVATGAWVHELLDPAGVDPNTAPRKRQMFTFKHPEVKRLIEFPFAGKKQLPVLIFPKDGIYLKPDTSEGKAWIGCSDNMGRPIRREDDPQPEDAFWEMGVHQVLRKYLPVFEGLKPSQAWAGHYIYHSADRTPVVFEQADCIVVSGMSGSGIMKADALGRVAAAKFEGKDHAELYGGRRFEVSKLSVTNRHVEYERFVI